MTLIALPTRTTINLANPTAAEYFDEGQVCYVLQSRDGKLRAWTSFGSLSNGYDVGSRHMVQHDQTGRVLGYFNVVAIVRFKDGEVRGSQTLAQLDKAIPHWVAK